MIVIKNTESGKNGILSHETSSWTFNTLFYQYFYKLLLKGVFNDKNIFLFPNTSSRQ